MAKILRPLTYRARHLRRTATEAERVLWAALRGRTLGAKFRRQQPIGPYYIADFFCAEAALVVELDGAGHFPRPPRDIERDAFMRACGLTVLRFENRAVFASLPRVLAQIQAALTPSPAGRGLG